MTIHPHEDYITAVDAAMKAGGYGASEVDCGAVSDGEHFDALFTYKAANPALNTDAWPEGLLVLWDERTGWQYAGLRADGSNEYPTGLPVQHLASPEAVVAALPDLLAGRTDAIRSIEDRWEHADRLQAALDDADVAA